MSKRREALEEVVCYPIGLAGLDELPLTRGHRRYIFEILPDDLPISSSIIQAEIKTEAEGGPDQRVTFGLVSDPLVRRCGALEASK